MIGFDPAAARTEYGLANHEIPVMLLAVGPMREGNWPSKPRRSVVDVLSIRCTVKRAGNRLSKPTQPT